MESYGPPVDQLLQLEEEPKYNGEWADYLAMGFGPEHIPDLIRMAVDPDLNDPLTERKEVWAPLHAWRTLGILRAAEAVSPLVGLLASQDDVNWDGWITEEMPKVLGKIGPPALFDLTALLNDESASFYARNGAAEALEEVAKVHPETRGEVVATLTRALERAEWNTPELNGLLVSNLLDLEAKESAEVIERAYAGEFVDDSICGTWYDVWHGLGLEGEPPPQTERLYQLSRDFDDDFDDDYGDFDRSPLLKPEGWQPTEIRTPDERKERNKVRQKLEKKVKGKKPKRR